MTYQINTEIRRRAKELGIDVKPSKNQLKKLDAYVNGVFQRSFGASGYMDYHLYKRKFGDAKAEQMRRSYKARHERDRHNKYGRDGRLSAGWLADKILW